MPDNKVITPGYRYRLAFEAGWKDDDVIRSYRDMLDGVPQCGVTGIRCRYIECKLNDKGKYKTTEKSIYG